jgi:hypothetical protein
MLVSFPLGVKSATGLLDHIVTPFLDFLRSINIVISNGYANLHFQKH